MNDPLHPARRAAHQLAHVWACALTFALLALGGCGWGQETAPAAPAPNGMPAAAPLEQPAPGGDPPEEGPLPVEPRANSSAAGRQPAQGGQEAGAAELHEPGAGEVATTEPADEKGGEEARDSEARDARYEFREEHDPNGIGKFYMGREIAHVMGFAAAPWLERPEREREEATSKMVEALELKPGMVVADIGAGSGVITLMLARKVAPDGRVIALDVQQEMLDLLEARLDREQVTNVELLLGTEKSPRLMEASLDLALLVDVYHEFAYPYEMMQGIARAMKPGGKVVFVEFRLEDPTVPIKLVHKMSVAQVRKEIGLPEFRLKWTKTHDMLPWQHIIIFERQPAARAEASPQEPPP
jgi:precorrin-6B methylase 2